jgi:Domain of unknown function (DUF2804), C-terminal
MSIRPAVLAELPWRGSAEERPAIAVPPEPMPLLLNRRLRKRWRWVGAFAENLLAFASIAEIGPLTVTFWGVWDRERRRFWERTRRTIGKGGLEVRMPGRSVSVRSRGVSLELELGEGTAIECVCPNGEGGYTWTRKLAGVPVRGEFRAGGRAKQIDGLAVEDNSAGYHRRHTAWRWSAGVGTSTDGRTIGWNLVSGINDPPASSERTIWVSGAPSEPGAVEFDGLQAIQFKDASRLRFEAETERTHHEGIPLLISSDYRAPLGRFAGHLPGGIELETALGVMEEHDVVW